MHTLTIKPDIKPQKATTVHIGSGATTQISSLFDLSRYSTIFIVTDKNVQMHLKKLIKALPKEATYVALPSGAQPKDLQSIQKIWKAMHKAGCDRQSLVINLGGGSIGDRGGFAASTYMRGVDFLNVPTTLLAQVDASVGGKTGFDFDGIKNLIGTFSQPMGVLVDPQLLDSLPPREFVSGFGEIIKHGLIWDKAHFKQATSKAPLKFTQAQLTGIIIQSIMIKSEIVQGDETETGMRKLLNFGHTIGHAIESLSLETDSPLLHGEAISIGMAAEAIIAHKQGLISATEQRKIGRALVKTGLPTTAPGFKISDILKKMQSDKKNSNGELNFTLPDGIGRAVYDQKVPKAVVNEALRVVTKKSR
jgi:3-dehydroquinate synthase